MSARKLVKANRRIPRMLAWRPKEHLSFLKRLRTYPRPQLPKWTSHIFSRIAWALRATELKPSA